MPQELWTEFLTMLTDHLGGFGSLLVFFLGFWQVRARASKQARKDTVKKLLSEARAGIPMSLHPEFNAARCVGCGTCTRACPENNVLKLVNHRPTLIGPSHCVGHGECEAVCPNGAITLVFGTKTRGMDIPRITGNYETNVPGLYIAGELGGMGLIRNAIKQGCASAQHALKNLPQGSADVELLIVGAGPAGIAAAMTAIDKKKTYLCIEQHSFGGTVYNFPRQKIVMTHPAELPITGMMKFRNNKISKEELLNFWNDIRKETGLKVQENVKFLGLEKQANEFFKVQTNNGTITAKKVILAMGVRGSPRKLGLPNEELPKVTYNLIDAEQYQNKDIAVVGGGNAGVEAAQQLARAEYGNRVTVLVRGEGFDTCNEENRKIILRLAEEERVRIHYSSSVKEIHQDALVLNEKGKDFSRISNHFLFVFAGAEMPHKFLMSLGIQIEKKFGEPLRQAA